MECVILQALAQLSAARDHEMLIRAPTTGRITLLTHEIESVLDGRQVLGISQYQIRLRRGAQRVDVTISVLARQHVFAFRQRIEKLRD